MKVIFKFFFIKKYFWLFFSGVALSLLMILLIIYLGIKEIKNARK